ncbi:molybdate ABC transporter substrate-binding protein [Clostridium niameyense]|uniref:Molybdate ABC transporter substrate-binding protein n=1 Tax=Clostridium niameyense TaxID=1622073 RepID=A0A6M0R9H5_9CLOT|nr:molybdate ABC transporter substrate-binding protein [Clostridium niameyense]NEZ46856.1 molybdate ABC transporter substrate-binding protein [Clostridium niameyense]
MNFNKKLLPLIVVFSLFATILVGCGSNKEEASTKEKSKEAVKQESLVVFSGAGLKKPMEEIKKEFEKENNVKVEYIYAGSTQLISQMELGNKGDVFIVGSIKAYDVASKKDLVNSYKKVAHHTPAIAVQKGNPKGIKSLEDMEKPGVKVVLGDEKANAIGMTAQKIIKKNNLSDINKNTISKAATVNEIVVQLTSSKADAAIVTSDSVFQNKDIDTIQIPKDKNIDQIIPVCSLKNAKHKELADKFVDLVASDKGKEIFKKYGFKPFEK